MATNLIPRMTRNAHPFQIKDPVTGVRVMARYIVERQEIEDRLAAWEIVSISPVRATPVQVAA
jgi:hypothetical protein